MRRTFTTTIEENIQKNFKAKCKENGDRMNDVLEAFMKGYINNEFRLEVEFKLKRS